MNDLVIMENHQAVTTSLKVAEVFGKAHYHVIEAIEAKISSPEKSGQYNKMFLQGVYQDNSGKANKMYYMNRDGFSFIAFGFTGRRADEFKLQYIEAFNQMEEQIKTGLPQTTDEKIDLLLQSSSDKNKRITNVENRVTDLEENKLLDSTEYNFLGKRVSAAVHNYKDVKKLNANAAQEKVIRKDINNGLNSVCGTHTRTQIREKDFDTALEFLKNWAPSTATEMKVKQLGDEDNGQTNIFNDRE